MFLLIKYTLLYTVVLMLVALGGMFSERSGIINIALEGIMVIGGLAGVIAIQMMPAGSGAQKPFIGFPCRMGCPPPWGRGSFCWSGPAPPGR